jgi:hypothetical protein
MAEEQLCVAIYKTHDQADEAFSRLKVRGFNTDLLSFVGRDSWADMVGSRHAGKHFIHKGSHGPFWQRLWSLLPGWGVFWFFESGPVLVAGPMARTIVAAQEEGNGASPSSRFVEGLSATGIPMDSVLKYEASLMNNQILVFIEGSLADIRVAQGILNETNAINHTVYHGAKAA